MSIKSEIDRINGQVSEQTSLISQIVTALQGKASGGGGSSGGASVETCTVTYYATDGQWDFCYYTTVLDGRIQASGYSIGGSPVEVTVVCGSVMIFEGWSGTGWAIEVSNGTIMNVDDANGCLAYEAPTEPNSSATVILS